MEKKTKDEIIAEHVKIHEELEVRYYKEGSLAKEEFDLFHGENWNNLEASLILHGFLEPRGIIRHLDEELDELKERVRKLELS